MSFSLASAPIPHCETTKKRRPRLHRAARVSCIIVEVTDRDGCGVGLGASVDRTRNLGAHRYGCQEGAGETCSLTHRDWPPAVPHARLHIPPLPLSSISMASFPAETHPLPKARLRLWCGCLSMVRSGGDGRGCGAQRVRLTFYPKDWMKVRLLRAGLYVCRGWNFGLCSFSFFSFEAHPTPCVGPTYSGRYAPRRRWTKTHRHRRTTLVWRYD
jgi:hypothetical protein